MARRSCVAIHPGKILRREMNATGLNSLKLADALHVPVNRIIEILSCDRDISRLTWHCDWLDCSALLRKNGWNFRTATALLALIARQ